LWVNYCNLCMLTKSSKTALGLNIFEAKGTIYRPKETR
jgi:hypothetical protein